ncbi:MAG: glycosyltransferase family 4 protein [Candidatus Pacebacteria bacterium]|nr:glycosyltransferase family 4 protein [Candidatus Paceibacterota bacterium]
MKIVIATGLYPPEIGGPATYAAMLDKELPEHGTEVYVVPFGWVRKYPKIIRHIAYFWKLWKECSSVDVIYALDPISVGLPALLVSRLRKKPLLIRLGGDYAWEQGRIRFGITDTLDEYLDNQNNRSPRVSFFAKLQTYVVSKAEQIIVPSHYLKGVVIKWGIKDSHIQVIYSALYPIEVTTSREVLRKELNYSHPTIVSAGRLVPWKGFEILINVVDELKEHYPHISLIIAGDGEEYAKLETQVSDLKLSQHVRFIGSVTKDTLGAVIKAADVFVLNTAYEGLSHQLIEVMNIGTPIVTTTAGGNSELITDGVDGFLVEFNNKAKLAEAIMRVINHPESRERIVQSARGRSKQFSKESAVQEIVMVLKNIHENN